MISRVIAVVRSVMTAAANTTAHTMPPIIICLMENAPNVTTKTSKKNSKPIAISFGKASFIVPQHGGLHLSR